MVGYALKNTLTENGYVSRGVCTVNEFGFLKEVRERTHIIASCDGPIVRVDDEKRRIEEFAAAQHRVPRAPRLHAPFRDGKALRQLIQLLEGVVCFHPSRHARTDLLAF